MHTKSIIIALIILIGSLSALGGHAGYTYLDANCKPLQIELFINCGPGSATKMFVTTGFD